MKLCGSSKAIRVSKGKGWYLYCMMNIQLWYSQFKYLYASTPFVSPYSFHTNRTTEGNVLTSMFSCVSNKREWCQIGKKSMYVPIYRKGDKKDCENDRTIALISHASMVDY